MATALDVITRALRKLRQLDVGEEPTAEEAEDALSDLNDMLAEWAIDGIDLALIDLELSDDIDLPRDHMAAIVLSLAERLGGEYGSELSPIDANSVERRRAILRAYHFTIADLRDDNPQARCNLPNYD